MPGRAGDGGNGIRQRMFDVRMFDLYYAFKPVIPRAVQLSLRRARAANKRNTHGATWPIDPGAAIKPAGWTGWPDGKDFALVLQHDVDTARGITRCYRLMEAEIQLGFRSMFCFVPEGYFTPPDLRRRLVESSFEVGVHGLKHDGKLFRTRAGFERRAPRINAYLKEWGATGFTTPSMIRNPLWMAELEIEHGCSTFDSDPFEPQSEGVGTIFPFHVHDAARTRSYVEHPYTLAQDHCLFIILREKTIDIWKEKLDWIAERGGMAYLNTHPDYMNFAGTRCAAEEYPARLYTDFLEYVQARHAGRYWHALPRDLARFWQSAVPDHSQASGALR